MLSRRGTFVVLLALVGTCLPARGAIMEAGKADSVTESFKNVSFNAPFSVKPVVVYLLGDANDYASGVRIRNVTTSGFQIAQKEANNKTNSNAAAKDGQTTPDTIHWFAIEPGVHTIGSLTVLAGSIDTTKNRKKGGGDTYETIDLTAAGFSNNPAVITAVNTFNNFNISVDPTSPWLASYADDTGLSPTSVRIALERAEVAEGTVSNNETLAYLAFDTGGANTNTSGTFQAAQGTIEYAGVFSQTKLDLESKLMTASFGTTFSTGAGDIIAVGEHSAGNGDDGGWMRSKTLTTSNIGVYLQEDQWKDTELAHGSNESAAILAFSKSFHTPEPATISLLALGAAALLRRRRSRA